MWWRGWAVTSSKTALPVGKSSTEALSTSCTTSNSCSNWGSASAKFPKGLRSNLRLMSYPKGRPPCRPPNQRKLLLPRYIHRAHRLWPINPYAPSPGSNERPHQVRATTATGYSRALVNPPNPYTTTTCNNLKFYSCAQCNRPEACVIIARGRLASRWAVLRLATHMDFIKRALNEERYGDGVSPPASDFRR